MSKLSPGKTMLTLQVTQELTCGLDEIARIEGVDRSKLARSVLHDFTVRYISRRALTNRGHGGAMLDLDERR